MAGEGEVSTRVLILASGQHHRWQGQRAKQLVPIAGEILLERTQRQVGGPCVTVTHLPAIQRFAQEHFVTPMRRWTVETLATTCTLWQERTIVLLGDVCYSDEAMEAILAYDGRLAVFGCEWEIFGLSFHTDICTSINAWPSVNMALKIALADAYRGGRGKLWEFYRAYCGFPLAEERLEDEIFIYVDDYTTDFDTIEEYRSFLVANPWAGDVGQIGRLLRSIP